MSLKERIELAKEQLGISEVDTQALEKDLGKKLVDYESTEALVAALMGYYNGELKKKANTSHTHDYASSSHKHKKADISDFPTSMKNPYALEIKMNGQNPVSYDGGTAKSINITAGGVGAYTKTETDEKFKNFCPFPIGSVLPMWNETNPTSLYLGTTWELISAGKYVQTGNTALQTGGSNSITIAKDNLPNIKINTTSATATINSHFHYTFANASGSSSVGSANYPAFRLNDGSYEMYRIASSGTVPTLAKTSNSGNGTTGSFTLQTEALGSGTPITIRPNYITLKFWKRLS